MKLYQIIASVAVVKDGWRSTTHLPMFYLRNDIQGITGETHAYRIARGMLAELVPDAVSIDIAVSVSAEFDPAIIGA